MGTPIPTINKPGTVNWGFSINKITTKAMAKNTYKAGNIGNKGARTGRSRLGSFFLNIKIPKIVKA